MVKGSANAFIKYKSVIFTRAIILLMTAPHTDFPLYAIRLSFAVMTDALVYRTDIAADTASSGKDDV